MLNSCLLAVDVIHLDLKWTWADRMNQACLKPIFEQWQLQTVIWDGASSHRGQDIGTLPLNRIFLPPYSPELNPAERIFEEIRREIEGFVYPSLQAKSSCKNKLPFCEKRCTLRIIPKATERCR